MALVPINYSLRSLFARKSTTILTVCSMGATVAVGYVASLVLPGPARAPEGLSLHGLDRSRVG